MANRRSHQRPRPRVQKPFDWPAEPSVTDEKSVYGQYKGLGLIGLQCAYRHVDVHEKAPYVSFRGNSSQNLTGLFHLIGIEAHVYQQLPKTMTVSSNGITFEVPTTELMNSQPYLKTYVSKQISKILDEQGRMMDCRRAVQKWAKDLMDPAYKGEIKVGQVSGLSEFGIPDTEIEKCQAVGGINHMNSPLDPSKLPSFDWPCPQTLLYLMAHHPDFRIGIARKTHYHGN